MFIIFAVFMFVLNFNIAGDEIRKYRVSMYDDVFISTCIYEQVSDKLHIDCESEYNKETFVFDDSQLIEWSNFFSETRHFSAKYLENTLTVDGTVDDETFTKSYDIEKQWIQSPPLMLTQFMHSDYKKIRFIMNTGPRIATMQAKKLKSELITINNINFDTQKIKITPTGIFSMFWTALLWIDKATGHFVKYQSPLGPPGSPNMVLEYIP